MMMNVRFLHMSLPALSSKLWSQPSLPLCPPRLALLQCSHWYPPRAQLSSSPPYCVLSTGCHGFDGPEKLPKHLEFKTTKTTAGESRWRIQGFVPSLLLPQLPLDSIYDAHQLSPERNGSILTGACNRLSLGKLGFRSECIPDFVAATV